MIFFTNTNLLTTRTITEQTTQEVTSTLENTTTAVFTTELITSTTEKTTEALDPNNEIEKGYHPSSHGGNDIFGNYHHDSDFCL